MMLTSATGGGEIGDDAIFASRNPAQLRDAVVQVGRANAATVRGGAASAAGVGTGWPHPCGVSRWEPSARGFGVPDKQLFTIARRSGSRSSILGGGAVVVPPALLCGDAVVRKRGAPRPPRTP